MKKKACEFVGCKREHLCKGLCRPHYMQRRRGEPLTAVLPPHGRMPGTEVVWLRLPVPVLQRLRRMAPRGVTFHKYLVERIKAEL